MAYKPQYYPGNTTAKKKTRIEYPPHLCPLCEKVLRIAESSTKNATQIEVKIECTGTDCPFKKVYTIGIIEIRQYGNPQN